ncbi:cupin domain-containing protein [Cryobacterium sp. TMT1-62]|uniref:cupin domain-containing protein n=1 Tax=Cryobacterium sp. TMT1-62 TaxID=1259240 RepID=UPI00106C43FA|nr:cupin domain-containing protein [Cryobacterium sp. TMT1-62]TFD35858.1 cupin domain-containing protein [Cryobacterium sp. TMT1-62]
MTGFVDKIEDAAIRNSNFRQVLYTARGLQLVVMALEPGEDIGEEVHPDRDQYFRVEKGKGEIWIDGTKTKIRKNSAMVVPAGARHNVLNTGGKVLRLTEPKPKQNSRQAKPSATQATAKPTSKTAAKPAAKTPRKPVAKRPSTRARSADTN